MSHARTRIRSVRLKEGGASLRVLHRSDKNEVVQHIREWFSSVAYDQEPPDAYAAVAFWFHKDSPGSPSFSSSYCTRHDSLTPALLCRIAAAQIAEEPAREGGAARTMHRLGYNYDGWEPDEPANKE